MELSCRANYIGPLMEDEGKKMLNRDIYQKDPTTHKLANEGVANVNDASTIEALQVLRYELETFVCDGQYSKGMADILDTFLKNIDEAHQPAVWVSGFYGSGKSHLVKMLRTLWVNTTFDDGATARGISNLPQGIRDSLKELSTQAKKHGGLYAASGTLGSSERGSVRLALLNVIFRSVGLPQQYAVAKFVMWLKQENIYDAIRTYLVENGYNWDVEIDNIYVATGLHAALMHVKPTLFHTEAACVETVNNLFPYRQDISSDEMLKTIRTALTRDGKFPLSLIVLDEVQQYIGEDSQKSIDVQEVVESCSKSFKGKLLFIGTGQTAITGTSNLKKLEGRFTVRVELSDTDVDAVVRQVILAKKAEAKAPIETMVQANLGEVSRHLANTTIGHRQEDMQCFSQDYPILPVRRRFWENALRVLDQTGTDSQLRNQLSMIHKVIQTNLDASLGTVVAADYLYFDAADKLLQVRMLPRKVHEKTMHWIQGSADDRLKARACGLVFLINKINASNHEIGIRATTDSLADLLVEDLKQGSASLRAKLPSLLEKCDLLMRVGDEYRIQTEESSAWTDEFLSQRSSLANEAHRIEAERDDRIRKRFGDIVRKLTLTQGNSKVSRDIAPLFDASLPKDADQHVYVWVRDGWNQDENSVRADARQAGNQSPVVFVFIPKRSADDLRHHLIDFKAATATLDKRGVPNSPEGSEARASMETTKQVAEARIQELLDNAFSGTRVFQGDGSEVLGNGLQEMVMEAAKNSLLRLYPQFQTADHPGWQKVYERAQKGAPDALLSVGDNGEPAKNAVCKGILSLIAGGKKGVDIRTHFEFSPYGWSRDAIDGGLQVLLIAGMIRAQDERGQTIEPKELERKSIGKVTFKIESTIVTTPQRIQVRKLLQAMGLIAKHEEELSHIPAFLEKLNDLATRAGGEAPQPLRPDTTFINEIRLASGNEQLIAIYNKRDELQLAIDTWSSVSEKIAQRWPNWTRLIQLLSFAIGISDAEVIQAQANTIEEQRQLLDEPDLVLPLVNSLIQLLRTELNKLDAAYCDSYQKGLKRLEINENWTQLESEQRDDLLHKKKLNAGERPIVNVKNGDEVVATLVQCNLSSFQDRIAAMSKRFDDTLAAATALCEPKTQFFSVPIGTLKTENDINEWVDAVHQTLKNMLPEGPISIC